MISRLEEAIQSNYSGDKAIAERLQGTQHITHATTVERAVSANLGQMRAVKTEEAKPGLQAHQTTTKAICPTCGNKPVEWLVRRGDSGPYKQSCSGCYGAIIRNL